MKSIQLSAAKSSRYLVLVGFGLCLLSLASAQTSASVETGQPTFSWSNVIGYHVMTDRFLNGNPANDNSYGRGLDGSGTPYPQGPEHFAGGDFAGLLQKVESNYFSDLGVNVLWISAPYEQIHGFVPSGDGARQAYAFHGYWPLDFTAVDANWGTEEEFAALVNASHARGIRVILDVVMNHPGYATIGDMEEFDFGGIIDSTAWQEWRPTLTENWSSMYDQFVSYSDSSKWGDWWSPEWIRAGLPGYTACGSDERTECLSYLPDFRTDSPSPVELPAFLVNKWSPEKLVAEKKELVAFFQQSGLAATPRNHLIKWLTDWVRKYGVDGFRVDTAKHLEFESLAELKRQAVVAHQEWASRTDDALPDNSGFWMVGEVFGYDGSESEYFNQGFDALLNFSFQEFADQPTRSLDSLFAAYADNRTPSASHLLTFVSSHDVGLFDRDSLRIAATNLMLLPGGISIFYGDETNRQPIPQIKNVDLASRSSMNWDVQDGEVLKQWQDLGAFRNRHPSVASGSHTMISETPYVFMRRLTTPTIDDVIVVATGAVGRTRIYVTKAFPDDAIVRDAVSGNTGFVSFGYVTINAAPSGLVLLELQAD